MVSRIYNESALRVEHLLFQERSHFIREHYPHHARFIIDTALDGFQVLESRNKRGDITALLTYDYAKDEDKSSYALLGIILVDEDVSGEGHMRVLWNQFLDAARHRGCAYVTARADTDGGADYLERLGFELVEDDRTREEFYRYDIA